MGFVGNCRHEPAGFAPGRRARLDDGQLDVRLLLAERRLSRLRLLGALLAGRLERSPAYETFATTRLRIDSPDGPLRLAADGDPISAGSSVTVAKAGRLAVYAP
jgi:undecaprenyl-diphosphatase